MNFGITTIILGLILTLGVIFFLWRKTSERYRLPCPAWLGWLVEVDNPFTAINRATTIIENIHLEPGMHVLDVGCGPGRVAIPVAQKVGPQGHVVALDIQKDMLRRCQEKARAEHVSNISFVNVPIEEHKLDYNSFDRVLLVTVLGEIPHQKKALQEIFKVLKPGGILSITEIILDPHYQRLEWVRQCAKEVAFKEKDIFQDWIAYTINLEKPA